MNNIHVTTTVNGDAVEFLCDKAAFLHVILHDEHLNTQV